LLAAYAVDLQEQRRNAHRMRIEAEIAAGMHAELVGELRSLVTTNPLDEGLHEQLMHVLSLNGRRLEALELFRELRAKLNEELGLEPCDDLQRLHHHLLSAGDSSAAQGRLQRASSGY
jgi:DNA-binding SARP family transcriptional activator